MTDTRSKDGGIICVKSFIKLVVLLGSSLRSERHVTADRCRIIKMCNDFRYPAWFPSASVPLFFEVEPLSFFCSPKNSIFSRYWPFLQLMWLWPHTAPLRHCSLAYDCSLNASLVAALSSTKTSNSQSFCFTRFVDGSEMFKNISVWMYRKFRKDTVYCANR